LNAEGAEEKREVQPAAEAPTWEPPAEDEKLSEGHPDWWLTDTGNAERFVKKYGDRVRYIHQWDTWFLWNGKHWEKDKTGRIDAMAKESALGLYEAAAEITDDKAREAVLKWAKRSASAAGRTATIALARSEPGIPVIPDDLDTNRWIVADETVPINLKEGKTMPSRREDLITKQADVEFQPDAKCPQWLAFLDMVMAGNQGLIDFLQKAVGYSLTGVCDERCIFILYGKGRNGKTTFVETIAGMMGDYAKRTSTETLLVKRYDGIPNDIAALKGARFVYAEEAAEARRLSEEVIKDLTGAGTVSARFMRQEWFSFKPEFKLWLCTNHKPVIRGTDDAIWDRIRLIPFTVRIPDEKIRPASEVEEMFRRERSGILNWAIEGCLRWQKEGLEMPEAVKNATNDYRKDMDILSDFLEDCCIVESTYEVSVKALHSAYVSWCEANGERAISKKAFGSRIIERGFDQYTVKNQRFWIGIGLQESS
jgi:putative DNA primase/helicase